MNAVVPVFGHDSQFSTLTNCRCFGSDSLLFPNPCRASATARTTQPNRQTWSRLGLPGTRLHEENSLTCSKCLQESTQSRMSPGSCLGPFLFEKTPTMHSSMPTPEKSVDMVHFSSPVGDGPTVPTRGASPDARVALASEVGAKSKNSLPLASLC